MKILWVKSDFLHPTTRGGQIRTLEMLKRLHARHEVHYVAFDDPHHPEGLGRSGEYCSRAHPIRHHVAPRRSLGFAAELLRGAWAAEPVSIRRYRSSAMRAVIERLIHSEHFDRVVCDFLTPAVNVPRLNQAVLFQHNVETVIWDRHAETASNPLARFYLGLQARRMKTFERKVCSTVAHIIAVSKTDARLMQLMFGVSKISDVPTGVEIDYFSPPAHPVRAVADLVFVGSMDWVPNIDAMRFFVHEVLPLIRRVRPNCSLAIVGRKPGSAIQALAREDAQIAVTGTVEDVRPYLWGSTVSIVPLRIGGGTRLKIYEAMAAKTAVVSTSIGAEGLDVTSPDQIRLADDATDFARECVHLLENAADRDRMASAAWNVVSSRFSWDTVARRFETILRDCEQI